MTLITDKHVNRMFSILQRLINEVEGDDAIIQEAVDLYGDLYNMNKLSKYEINLGNVIISGDNLTCINDESKLVHYELLKTKAKKNDIIYIVNSDETLPFGIEAMGRFFRVTDSEDKECLEWVVNHVVIGDSLVYDSQYLVLKEIK